MHEPLRGQYLGRYRIDALLGEGGMALVYRAVDPAVGRDVAIKVVHPSLARDPAFVARFLREARVVARLQHPNILPLLDTGEQGETPYLVMPYAAGGTLEDWLARGRTPAEVLSLARPIAAALDHAHERGVIHRDVKPSNVLIDADGTPLLSDFGIAHAIGDSKLTATGMHIGSALYMAPEQVQGVPLTGSVDQYALAAMLYEALAGHPPFVMAPTDTSFSLMLRKLGQPPPPPSSLNPALPPACDAVLLRALAREPGRRFTSCVALVDALTDAVALPREPALAGTVPPPPYNTRPNATPPARKARPFWWIVAGMGLGLLLCVGIATTAVVARALAGRETPTVASAGAPPSVIATRTPTRSGAAQQGSGITEAGTARSITSDKKPNQRASEFRDGDEVFVTFTATRVRAGQFVDLKLFRDGQQIAMRDTQTFFEADGTYYGYYSFEPNVDGIYRAELYFNDDSTPSQTVSFTVR